MVSDPRSALVLDSPLVRAWAVMAARLIVFVAFFDLFVQYPLAAPYAESLGATPALIGLVVASYSIANLAGNIAAGILLDRFGRLWPLVIGAAITSAVLIAYTLVAHPVQLLAVRLLHGLAVAVLAPGTFALIGDLAAPDQRARAMGLNGALIAAAAVIAPPLAGIVQARAGYAVVFLADAALMAVATLVALVMLLLLPSQQRVPRSVPSQALLRRYARLFSRDHLRMAYGTIIAFATGLGFLVTHLPLALEVTGGSPADRGLAFGIYGGVAALLMASPLTRVTDRRTRAIPAALGLVLIGLGLLVLVTGLTRPSLIVGMTVFGLGFGFLFPAASALVVEASDRDERGFAFGVFYALYSIGVVLGALWSGFLAELAGSASSVPFLAGGTLAAAAGSAALIRIAHKSRFHRVHR